MHPLVSIIIPTFNSELYLNDTLTSVLQGSYTHWECIIVDDGSEDKTSEISLAKVQSDHRFTFHKRPEQKLKGANSCRNYGFEQSKGEYVLFLDSDDILKSNCLEKRLNVFKSFPNTDFVVGNTALIVDSKFTEKVINSDPDQKTTLAYLLKFLNYDLPWTSTLSVLWKRTLLKTHRFDESLLRFQDIDFHISILMGKLKMERLYSIDSYYRVNRYKIKDHGHIKLVLENLVRFFQKHENFVLSNESYKSAFRAFMSNLLFLYVFPNYRTFKRKSKEVLSLLYKSNLFDKRQLNLLKMKEFLVNIRIDRIKYIGMYKFSTFIKRELEG